MALSGQSEHNYFRDYDLEVGRYIQSDPIGLEGGLIFHLYSGIINSNEKNEILF